MNPADRWSRRGRFDDLPIQLKASLASALLLVCLLALGAHAYLTSTRSAAGLQVLSGELVPKQQAFADVGDAVVAAHMKIFRLVSWASNGVSDKVLMPLEVEINAELEASSERIAALTRRPDLSDDERQALQELLVKWQNCKEQARDTIDVARTDAPMATMMIGQTDDSFEAVDGDLRKMSLALAAKANRLQDQLSTDAQRNQQVVVWVTLLGLLISVVVAVVIGRSIVRPIRSITDVMQRLSAGEIDVPVDQGKRHDEIGQMAQAIDVFRRNIIEKHAVERTLAESIEAITEGFSLYDAEDRLVVCNSHYREMFSYGADTVAPGMTFERIVGAAVGRVVLDGAGDGPAWLAQRIERHRNPTGPHVQHRVGRPLDPGERAPHRSGRRGRHLHRHLRAEKPRGGTGPRPCAGYGAERDTAQRQPAHGRRAGRDPAPADDAAADARRTAAGPRPGYRLPHAGRARGRRRLLRRAAARRAGQDRHRRRHRPRPGERCRDADDPGHRARPADQRRDRSGALPVGAQPRAVRQRAAHGQRQEPHACVCSTMPAARSRSAASTSR